MKTRRLAVAGVTAVAFVALTGCGSGSDDKSGSTPAGGAAPAAATTAPADPASEFEAAVSRLGEEPTKLDLTMVGGITLSGGVDGQGGKADLSTDMGQLGSMRIRQIGKDMWVKAEGQLATAVGGSSSKWMHIDTSTVPESSAINVKNNDPKATAKMFAASADVKKAGEGAFTGTVDLTKSPTFNKSAASALGDKVSQVPFTATLDGQGRVSELDLDLESVAPGSGKMVMKYSGYGEPIDVQAPPAGETMPMPAQFRKAVGA